MKMTHAPDNNARITDTVLHLHPSAFLLTAQFLQLGLYAFLGNRHNQQIIINGFGVLVLVLVVWVINRSPGVNWIAWILAIPAFGGLIYALIVPDVAIEGWTALFESILYFYAAGSLIAYMMKDDQVTTDELFAVGATFTLLAWGFAFLYLACQSWQPASFYSTVIPPLQPLNFVAYLSLSFTNLTATGLSDIVATSNASKVIVMLEQFCGIGYVAMVVSRLVGLTLQRKKKKDAKIIE